jgi:hypothetical protein
MALIIAAELDATASPVTGWFHTLEDGKTVQGTAPRRIGVIVGAPPRGETGWVIGWMDGTGPTVMRIVGVLAAATAPPVADAPEPDESAATAGALEPARAAGSADGLRSPVASGAGDAVWTVSGTYWAALAAGAPPFAGDPAYGEVSAAEHPASVKGTIASTAHANRRRPSRQFMLRSYGLVGIADVAFGPAGPSLPYLRRVLHGPRFQGRTSAAGWIETRSPPNPRPWRPVLRFRRYRRLPA